MCFGKIPDPKPAPPTPDPNKATLAAIEQQRLNANRSSASSNILAKLRDSDVSNSSMKTKLGA